MAAKHHDPALWARALEWARHHEPWGWVFSVGALLLSAYWWWHRRVHAAGEAQGRMANAVRDHASHIEGLEASFATLRTELRAELATLRTELRAELATMHTDASRQFERLHDRVDQLHEERRFLRSAD